MQCVADDLVGDVRAVEVAGVDVIDAAGNRLAQHRASGLRIFRWSEHAGPRELHRAVADPLDPARAELERSGSIDVRHRDSPCGRAKKPQGGAAFSLDTS